MDKLKFSQLLRIGSRVVKHIRCQLFHFSNKGIQGACSIGMIIIAKAGSTHCDDIRQARNDIDVDLNDIRINDYTLRDYIIDLNDNTGKNPDEIANELEKLGY